MTSWPRDADGNSVKDIHIKERLDDLDTRVDVLEALTPYAFSGVELAYAENGTGTVTTYPISPAASTVIPWTMIEVPGGSDPVVIHYGGAVNVATTGGGLAAIELWDVSAGGTGTLVHAVGKPIVASMALLFSGFANTLTGQYRLDVSATERVFQLKCLLYRDSGSTAAQVANGARNANTQPTFIRAVRG